MLPKYLPGTVQGFCCVCEETAILRWENPGVKRWCYIHGIQAIQRKFGDEADEVIKSAKMRVNHLQPKEPKVQATDGSNSYKILPALVKAAIAQCVLQDLELTSRQIAEIMQVSKAGIEESEHAQAAIHEARKQYPHLAPKSQTSHKAVIHRDGRVWASMNEAANALFINSSTFRKKLREKGEYMGCRLLEDQPAGLNLYEMEYRRAIGAA